MKKSVVLSASGPDRVGVADDLAAALAERSIHIEDSRWTAVGGRFSVVAMVSGEPEAISRLSEQLSPLREDLGFDVQFAPIDPSSKPRRAPRYVIECFAKGPPEMNAVTSLLKRHGVNIDQLDTEVGAESFTSRLSFVMTARVTIPRDSAFSEVEHGLRRLERERDVDVVIRPLGSRRAVRRKLVPGADI